MENISGIEADLTEGEALLNRLERAATVLEETSKKVDRRLEKVCASQPASTCALGEEQKGELPSYLAGLREQIARIEKATAYINDVMNWCAI